MAAVVMAAVYRVDREAAWMPVVRIPALLS
jgi:hypothetical protein